MRILYVNDIHFSGTFPAHYPKSRVAVPRFSELLVENAHGAELVVVGGDCSNRGPAEIAELIQFRDLLDRSGIPYQVIAGNHDIAPSPAFAAHYPGMEDMEDCTLEQTNFGRVFGPRGLRHVQDLGDLRLLFFSIRDGDGDGQLDWVQAQIGQLPHTLVFCHYPLVASRRGGFCKEWEYQRIASSRQRLIELMSAPENGVRAYFCGHQHINSRMALGPSEQIVTGALGMGTCCYRLLDITDDEIQVSTHRLPDIPAWLDDAMQPNRSSDEDHPDMESYHWGNDDERDFVIHLR